MGGAAEVYREIKVQSKELKQYTLDAISDEDFMFTDWKEQKPAKGIKGPEEVKKGSTSTWWIMK